MIRRCRKKDIDTSRPKSEQCWCLYSKATGKLLGRHPTKESAEKQERVIQMKKHGNVLLGSLFTPEEVGLLRGLLEKMIHNT